jgi:hypothetical protein
MVGDGHHWEVREKKKKKKKKTKFRGVCEVRERKKKKKREKTRACVGVLFSF